MENGIQNGTPEWYPKTKNVAKICKKRIFSNIASNIGDIKTTSRRKMSEIKFYT